MAIEPTVANNFFAFPRDGINLFNAVGARKRWTNARHVYFQTIGEFIRPVGVRKCIRHVPFARSMIDPVAPWLSRGNAR